MHLLQFSIGQVQLILLIRAVKLNSQMWCFVTHLHQHRLLRRWKHLALTALLLLVLVYVYAVLAFVFFRQLAVVEVDRGYVRDCVDPPRLR
jgi:hypothetical protein